MELAKLIKEKIKQNKVTLGYKAVMRSMKTGHPDLIIIANNLPEEKRRVIEHNAKISKIQVEEYPKDSVNLGLLCGKPFSVGVLAIKGGKK
jgi:large subunit ribosomal protein L30e